MTLFANLIFVLLSSVSLMVSNACFMHSEINAKANSRKEAVRETRLASLAPNEPEPPRAFVNTILEAPTGKVINVAAGGDLQAAIDQAKPGDVISLQAGATFTGTFTLPKKAPPSQGSPWIIIRTATPDANFPAQGTRVTPANAALMPKIVVASNTPAIQADPGANHYRFIGLEVGIVAGTEKNVELLDFSGNAEKASDLPSDLIVDRCYVHGNDTGDARRGITLNSAWSAVIDSYLANFHEVGADSQALLAYGGPGPYKIVNNYLEGAGENVMFGGADPTIQNLIPSDVEFRNNLCSKPLTWNPAHSSYKGIEWTVKNLFELKNVQRILIDRNTFEYNWPQGQSGNAIVFTPRNQDGGAPWSVTQDITFTNNIVRHSGGAFNMSGYDDNFPSQKTKRVLIKNNLFEDINGTNWGTPTEPSRGLFVLVTGGVDYLTVEHNTVFQSDHMILADELDFPNTNFVFRNNIVAHNEYGVFGSGVGVGNDALAAFFPGAVFTKNVIIGGDSKDYPAGNFFITAYDQVGFVNLAQGNYRLTPTSPYYRAATDGTNIGCDIDALTASNKAVSVNAANYRDFGLAPESIASAFGSELATKTESILSLPLPVTLGGTTVQVQDSTGVERQAPLFYVSPTQINYLIPSGTAYGAALISIRNSLGVTTAGTTLISRISPGLFTFEATGQGIAAGQSARFRNNVQQTSDQLARYDSSQNKWVAIPVDLTFPTDQVYLILYGTGLRGRNPNGIVTAKINGVDCQVTYAGAQPTYAGLDQVNVLLPNSLAGKGEANLVLTVDQQEANPVSVTIK